MSKTIALVGKQNAGGIANSLAEIATFLTGAGFSVVLEAETAQVVALEGIVSMSLNQIGQHADVAVVLGGDGTMLGIARQLAPFNVPLIGINQGRLGFMTDIPIERMIPVLADILAGKCISECRWPFHVQPALRRIDHCDADWLYRVCLVGWRAFAAPKFEWHRAGADCAACFVEPSYRSARQ